MRSPRRGCALLLVAVGLLAGGGGASAQQAFFEEGNRRYQEGDYDGALERYLQIVDAGLESGPLYYNIGNAYFKQGELGRAILYYERALELAPRDDDARANLELARSLTADEITPLPGFWLIRAADWWVHAVPRTALAVIVTLAYLGGAAALVAYVLAQRARVRVWAVRATVVAGLLLATFGINLAVIEFGWGQPTEAIILADEVPVQSAPTDDQALEVFAIHEGTKVRIDQQSGDWAEIVLADGKVGWVQTEVLEII
jgi:tetratricopeptide (TPR) repeat protein